MIVSFTGHCPVSNSEQAIKVTYVENSTLDGPRKAEKGTGECPNRIQGTCPVPCPVHTAAPDKIDL